MSILPNDVSSFDKLKSLIEERNIELSEVNCSFSEKLTDGTSLINVNGKWFVYDGGYTKYEGISEDSAVRAFYKLFYNRLVSNPKYQEFTYMKYHNRVAKKGEQIEGMKEDVVGDEHTYLLPLLINYLAVNLAVGIIGNKNFLVTPILVAFIADIYALTYRSKKPMKHYLTKTQYAKVAIIFNWILVLIAYITKH